MFNNYFCDLHIHIGRAGDDKPVKITASRKLNFANIAEESYAKKGLDLIGIIDCASPPVINDIQRLISKGEMVQLDKGGIKYQELVIIPGAEVESTEENGGQAHYLAYFPFLDDIKEFSIIMDQYITNINLSSQVTGLKGSELLQIVDNLGGILLPAHAFTPHKSFYGRCVSSFREIFNEQEWQQIPGIELGLSADSFLAGHLKELSDKSFLSNSDAHSLPKIAREYNIIKMEDLNFEDFKMALENKKGRKIVCNYGLDPRLGKYHRSFCPLCEKSFSVERPVLTCPECNNDQITVGVKDRILAIGDQDQNNKEKDDVRWDYIHQVPLLDVPGIGPKTMEKLINRFNTEMNILHEVDKNQLQKCVSSKIANNIIAARTGEIEISAGGGGNYGKVVG